MPSIKPRCVRLRCLRHQLKAAGSSARTTTFACTSYSILLRWALRYMTSTSFMFTALWLIYGPICTLIPCLVRINFGTNSLDCFIVVWLVMFAARPDLCWIITATFDLIVGLKNKGGNSWDRCAPPPLYLKQYCTVYRNIEFRSELFITIVHQCYGSGMYHVYPGRLLIFTHLGSRIQKRQQKRGGESLFSYRIMYPQIKFMKNYRIFPQQNCHLSLNNLREFSKKSKRS